MLGNDNQLYLAGMAAHRQGRTDARAPLVFLHGLTYDRRQWRLVLDELAVLDPDRRIVTLDLPGHGGSPALDPSRFVGVADLITDLINEAVREAELDAPVIIGHSLGGILATSYGAKYPARGVVNLDQPLRLGGFGTFLQKAEQALRGPGFVDVWNRLLANMGTETLPPAEQHLLRTATTVRQDLLLGYWADIFADPDAADERCQKDLQAIAGLGIPYHYISGSEPSPGYREWMQSQLPTVDITVLPGSGHFPHLAHPRVVAEIVNRIG